MINFFTKFVLKKIDSIYHRKKILNYFKKKKFKFKLILDIGSNIGEYTMLFKNINKNIEVVCLSHKKKYSKN